MSIREATYLFVVLLMALLLLGIVLYFSDVFLIFSAIICVTFIIVIVIAIVFGIIFMIIALPYYAATKKAEVKPGTYSMEDIKGKDE